MDLRLATFNLENLGIREDDDAPWLRDRLPRHVESLRGTLRRLDADAVAVQEVIVPSLLEELAESLGYPHVALSERSSSPLLVGVISRYPLKEARTVAKDAAFSVADPKSGLEIAVQGAFSRGALRLLWDVPGFPTELFVVHWKSKIPSYLPSPVGKDDTGWNSHGHAGEGRLLTEIKRLAQAVELRKEIDRSLASDPGRRIAILGDFNDVLESECLRILRGDSRGCEAPHLVPSELTACELSVPQDLRYTQIYRGQKEMLDHVLVSRALVPHLGPVDIFHEGLAEAAEGPSVDLYSDASDHAPVRVTFRT